MKPENIKIVEIRDRLTFIPAFAIRMIPENNDEKFIMMNVGYRNPSNPCILLISLQAPWISARYSEEWNDKDGIGAAHKWIEDNWNTIVSGHVIDIEYILKEVDKPCLSIREEKIRNMFVDCTNYEDRSNLLSSLLVTRQITPKDFINKYLYWKCDVCNKVRPDKFISVQSFGIDSSLEADYKPELTITHNIKYCNDNEDCIIKSKKN